MHTENRPVYISDDGLEFDSEKECLKHEFQAMLISCLLLDTGIRFDSIDEERFLGWLDDHVAKWKPFAKESRLGGEK